MVAELVPERDMRGPGCDDRCQVIRALVPGLLGRSELLLHDAQAHEAYGRWQANPTLFIDSHVLVTGPLAVNLSSLDVLVDGQPVWLTATEVRLLCLLARRVGAVVGQNEMLSTVWGPEYVGEGHLLRVNMARVRGKLGQAGALITTVVGIGYRLNALSPGLAAPPVFTRRYEPLDRWARNWDSCRICERTDIKHRAGGVCGRRACRRAAAAERQVAQSAVGGQP